MVVSSLVSLLCCFCWCESHPIPPWYHPLATPSTPKTMGCDGKQGAAGTALSYWGSLPKMGKKRLIPNVEQVTGSKEHAEKVHGRRSRRLEEEEGCITRSRDEGCSSGMVSLDSGLTKPDSIPTQVGPEPVLSAQEVIKQ